MEQLNTRLDRQAENPNAEFWGERLQLVREFLALTQKELGERVKVSHALISDYEKGKRFPNSSALENIADATGFLPGFFLRRLDDPFLESECSFRHRRSTSERLKDQVRARATLLGTIITALKKTFRFPEFNVPSIPARSLAEIEKAAESCRIHWGLDPNAPLLQVGRAIERAGVIIISSKVDTKKIDAFSRYGSNNSIIFLNDGVGSWPSRWNFDLAHEYGHLVMHRDLPTGSMETEVAADSFASAFLLPRNAFAREFRTRLFTWQHIFELKRRWQVSAAAIIRRARDLELIDENTYRQAFQYMSFKKWRTEGEPFEPTFQEPELLMTALRSLGNEVKTTLPELCEDVQLTPHMFTEITGFLVAKPEQREGTVLSFPNHGIN